MATDAILNDGIQLGVSDSAEGPFDYFHEVTNVGWPSVTVSRVRATHYGTTGRTHDEIPGWKTGEDVAVTYNYRPATYSYFANLEGLPKFYQIVLPDGFKATWPGFVSRNAVVAGEAGVETPMRGEATITVTGEVETDDSEVAGS